jgi:hypothetical protein
MHGVNTKSPGDPQPIALKMLMFGATATGCPTGSAHRRAAL